MNTMGMNCTNKEDCAEDELCAYKQNSYTCQLWNLVGNDSWIISGGTQVWYPPENEKTVSQKCESPPLPSNLDKFYGNCQDNLFCDGVCMQKLHAGTKCVSNFQCIENARCEDKVCTSNSSFSSKTTIIVVISLLLLIAISLVVITCLIRRKKVENRLSRKLSNNFEDPSSQRLSSARYSSTNQSLAITINGDLIENGPYYGDNSDLRRYRLDSFMSHIFNSSSRRLSSNDMNQSTILFEDEFYDSPPPAYIS
ncbi:9241_t:CDS:2 [Diversispora eburnea]|uniref:9241_t:CDS:1 n=1 Tax=Diversispora eburnea TaxID=1213867 RepID=A0A9N9F7K2_9GLOM|nr:9241_t:CDS:2 [Diversispora eburnea]